MKGYRTLVFQAIMTVGGLITIWTGVDTTEGTNLIKDNLDLILTAGTVIWGVGSVWLRVVTDSPLFKKR
jgi:hypothetical protein